MSRNRPINPSKARPITIVLTGGGSGGHITPLLSLVHALKKAEPRCRIIYVGLVGDKLDGLEADYKFFDEVHHVRSGKFRRYHGDSLLARLIDIKTLALNARDSFRVLAGTISARRLLKRLRPDVVFSKGGYVVVPVGMAAHQLNIPIVTHDSDAVAGLANKIVGRWARIHATGMPADYYSYPKDSIRYTGIPVDEVIKPVTKPLQDDYKKQLDIPTDRTVLMVSGGGLGSQRVNDLVLAIAPSLLKHFADLFIIHISGDIHEQAVKQKYQHLLSEADRQRVRVTGFSDQFYKLSGAADLIIARAGATTLAELATQAKACIIIPAPFLAGGHQLKNAEALERSSAARVVDETTDPQDLLKLVIELLQSDQKRAELGQKIAKLAHPDAARQLAEIILNVGRGQL